MNLILFYFVTCSLPKIVKPFLNVYYLVNFTPNPGVYSSSQSRSKIDLGFDKTILEFEFDLVGKFILVSYDGSYYWKE